MSETRTCRLAPQVLNIESVQQWLSWIAGTWTARDMDAMLSVFTADVIVDYGDQPRMVGVATLRRFLERRFAPVLDYELRKHALAAHADHIVAELDIRSRASVPGAPALRARGLEFLVIRERRVAVWKMTINPHPDGP